MCGRFARATELEAINRLLRFDTSELTELHPHYNVVPSHLWTFRGDKRRPARFDSCRPRRAYLLPFLVSSSASLTSFSIDSSSTLSPGLTSPGSAE